MRKKGRQIEWEKCSRKEGDRWKERGISLMREGGRLRMRDAMGKSETDGEENRWNGSLTGRIQTDR